MTSGYELMVVGASWGGLRAVSTLLDHLPAELELAVAVAQHRSADSHPGMLEGLLQHHSPWPVEEAGDKQPIERRRVYVAPPDYHLLVEPGTFALSLDARVQYARPAIDVLFESAADAYGDRLVGVILTGANEDGAAGLAYVKRRGGVAIVQDPAEAERAAMPNAALAATPVDAVLGVREIGRYVAALSRSYAPEGGMRT